MGVDEWEAAGLYDPSSPTADQRLELLEHLAGWGLTVDELVAANAAGQLITAASDRMVQGNRTLTAGEVAAQTGVPLDRVLQIWLATGLPIEDPERTLLPDITLEETRAFMLGRELFGEEATLAFSRVLGAAAAQVAEAAVALFLGEVQSRLEAERATELQRAEANEEAIKAFATLPETVARLVREHAVLAIRRSRAARGPNPAAPSELEVAVSFVDLVGSTAWGQGLSLRDQAVALARFESAAWEGAVLRDGRVVKMIGDAAMIVATTVADACAIACDVCARVAADPVLPPARAAVGFGAVMFRDGDYFGPEVNVVARAVKVGPPGSVILTEAAWAALGPDTGMTVGELTTHHLHGIETPVRLALITP